MSHTVERRASRPSSPALHRQDLLASRGGGLQLGDFRAWGRLLVASDAFVERFRDLLAVGRTLQVAFVLRTTHKRNLGKNGGDGCAGQHRKSRVLDTPVANVRAARGQGGVERSLNTCRETARLLYFFMQPSGR